MKTKVLFSEKQKFTQWWLWLIIIGVDVAFLISVYKQAFASESSSDQTMMTSALIIASIVLFLVTVLFLTARLDTKIDKTGIHVRFYPIRISYKFFPWKSIEKMEIRKYKPLLEYGGWGIRYGNGKALNISGNMGLQIVFTTKKKLLIGTRKPDELEKVINTYKK